MVGSSNTRKALPKPLHRHGVLFGLAFSCRCRLVGGPLAKFSEPAVSVYESNVGLNFCRLPFCYLLCAAPFVNHPQTGRMGLTFQLSSSSSSLFKMWHAVLYCKKLAKRSALSVQEDKKNGTTPCESPVGEPLTTPPPQVPSLLDLKQSFLSIKN